MKSITKLSLVLLTAVAFAAFPAQAQSDSTATTNAPAPVPRPRAPRFAGTITGVDATAMTLTLKGRGADAADVTVKVTSDTQITKDREPAVFADIKEGLRASGSRQEAGRRLLGCHDSAHFDKSAASAGAGRSSDDASHQRRPEVTTAAISFWFHRRRRLSIRLFPPIPCTGPISSTNFFLTAQPPARFPAPVAPATGFAPFPAPSASHRKSQSGPPGSWPSPAPARCWSPP